MRNLNLLKELSRASRAVILLVSALVLAAGPAAANDYIGDPCAKGNLEPADDVVEAFDEKIVIDVLANDKRPRGLALTVKKLSTTCSGTVDVVFDTIVYDPSPPLMSKCEIEYQVADDRQGFALLTSSATVTVLVEGTIFTDGFEIGDTTNWSACDGC